MLRITNCGFGKNAEEKYSHHFFTSHYDFLRNKHDVNVD